MKKILLLPILLLLILSIFNINTVEIKNKEKEKYRESENIEVWLLTAQERTNVRKYKEAIEILNEILVKFPDKETLSINYNIGYNFYKLKNYDEAQSYLNRVVSLFENSQLKSEEIYENRKYVILAGIVIDRIEKDKVSRRDPYHVQEDLKEMEKRRPKRPVKELPEE